MATAAEIQQLVQMTAVAIREQFGRQLGESLIIQNQRFGETLGTGLVQQANMLGVALSQSLRADALDTKTFSQIKELSGKSEEWPVWSIRLESLVRRMVLIKFGRGRIASSW